MTKNLFGILALGLAAGIAQAADNPSADAKNPFKDEREKVSYALGISYGTGWKRAELDLDVDAISKGMKDAAGTSALLSENEAREILMKYQKDHQQEMQAKQADRQKKLGDKNRAEGEAFLAKNKTAPSVITLPSGLQYKVLADGPKGGDNPKADDMVNVKYRGTLIDGTEFDSSEKPGRPSPASFQANRVISGWTEALQLMKPGDKWQLFIPPGLAYKEHGSPPNIGPEAVLIFEVELVSSSHPAPPPPPQPLTSDIIKVPSAEELKKGAKIETIKPEDIEKEKAKELAKPK
jgi:FKBP-type peptidyl-prolyl cis-trans isomerase FklB